MIIRAAQASDAAEVTLLWNTMIRDTLATFTTEERLEAGTAALIVERQDQFWVAQSGGIQGFVTFGPFRSGPGYVATVEHTILLAPQARRGGTGRQLMRHAMAAAAAQGRHVMVAAISSANPGAIAFHEKLGFERTGHMPQVGRKAGQWLDLFLMQKVLTPT